MTFSKSSKGFFSAAVAALMGAALLLPVDARAGDGASMVSKTAVFEDVVQDLQDAIINRGLVIDYVGNVDKMLERTSDAVGGTTPFKGAKYMHFCSAKLTNGVVSADPANVAVCPYVVFAYETTADPGTVVVGYRKPPEGATDASKAALGKIDALLSEIVKEATAD